MNLLDEVNSPSTGTRHDDAALFIRLRIAPPENLQSVSIAWMAMPPYLLDERLPGNEYGSEAEEDNLDEEERKTETNLARRTGLNITGIFQEIVCFMFL